MLKPTAPPICNDNPIRVNLKQDLRLHTFPLEARSFQLATASKELLLAFPVLAASFGLRINTAFFENTIQWYQVSRMKSCIFLSSTAAAHICALSLRNQWLVRVSDLYSSSCLTSIQSSSSMMFVQREFSYFIFYKSVFTGRKFLHFP